MKNHRLAFHIPHVACINGDFYPIPYAEFEEAFGDALVDLGVDGWHIVEATGVYKGRRYKQDILVVFCNYDEQKSILDAFKSICSVWSSDMMQEQFAYEHDGVLVTF